MPYAPGHERPGPSFGRLRWIPFLLLALLPAGCDTGPSGPGSWEVVIEGPVPVGSAAFVLTGAGIQEVEGIDGSIVFAHTPSGDGSIRVVAFAPAGAANLSFRVRVRNLGAPPPSGALSELFDLDDHRIPSTSGYRLDFRR
jgi:hypothetical protein